MRSFKYEHFKELEDCVRFLNDMQSDGDESYIFKVESIFSTPAGVYLVYQKWLKET